MAARRPSRPRPTRPAPTPPADPGDAGDPPAAPRAPPHDGGGDDDDEQPADAGAPADDGPGRPHSALAGGAAAPAAPVAITVDGPDPDPPGVAHPELRAPPQAQQRFDLVVVNAGDDDRGDEGGDAPGEWLSRLDLQLPVASSPRYKLLK